MLKDLYKELEMITKINMKEEVTRINVEDKMSAMEQSECASSMFQSRFGDSRMESSKKNFNEFDLASVMERKKTLELKEQQQNTNLKEAMHMTYTHQKMIQDIRAKNKEEEKGVANLKESRNAVERVVQDLKIANEMKEKRKHNKSLVESDIRSKIDQDRQYMKKVVQEK